MQKSYQKVQYLNILIIGGTGCGKSCFIDLFMKKFNYSKAKDIITKRSKT